MGQLTFEGVSAEDAKRLAARFKLKTGDVYDASYPPKYSSDELSRVQTTGGARPQLSTAVDTDRAVVDEQVVFK
jgi:hypothetical protein